MSRLALQTETERKLYVDALLVCLSRGVITEEKACEDLLEIAAGTQRSDITFQVRPSLNQRVTGIMAAYRSGAIDRSVFRQAYEALLVDSAPGPA